MKTNEQVCTYVLEHDFSLEQALMLVTSNTARVLKLSGKGKLEEGRKADVLVLRKDLLGIIETIANGQRLVSHGMLVVTEKFLEESNRSIMFEGLSTNS